jgi:hypothetical protein
MKNRIILCLFILTFIPCFVLIAQQTENKLKVQTFFGWSGNFYVKSPDYNTPNPNERRFFRKDFSGTGAGFDISYQIGKRGAIGLGYARSVNKGTQDWEVAIGSNTLAIQSFDTRHENVFVNLFYEHKHNLKNEFYVSWQVGFSWFYSNQQEISISNNDPLRTLYTFQERKRMENGGVISGIEFGRKLSSHVDLGIRTRLYWITPTGLFESIFVSPVLSVKL